MKTKRSVLSLIGLFSIFFMGSFLISVPEARAQISAARCTLTVNVDNTTGMVTISGTVRESRPGQDPSFVSISIWDSAGIISVDDSANADSISAQDTKFFNNGTYRAFIFGETFSNPGGGSSTCEQFQDFQVDVVPPPPDSGNIHVNSNRSTNWVVSGPPNFGGGGVTGGPYTAPAGTYSISADDLACYSKSYSSNPSDGSLISGGDLYFTITYTDDGSCGGGGGSPPGPYTLTSATCTNWPTPRIQIRLTASAGATSYGISRRVNGVWQIDYATNLSYDDLDGWIDTNINGGSTYVYEASARNAYGETDSNQLTVIANSANCGGSSPPPDQLPVGYLDVANCSIIGGWAYDPDIPSSEIVVHVYDGSTYVTWAATTGERLDVNGVFGISGNHGFTILTPPSLKDGNPHSITVYAINNNSSGGNPPLANTPIIVNCPPPTLTFTADSYSLSYNGSTTLRWSGTNIDTCTASGAWSGNKAVPSGTQGTGNLAGPSSYLYALTCSGPGGSIQRSFSIAVAASVPTVDNVTISSPLIRPDNTTQYNIVITGSDAAGGANISHEFTLINLLGSNSSSPRGYFTWYYDSGYTGWDSLKNKRLCSGGGVVAMQPGYGVDYANLDACSTSVSGNTRTTIFTVRFDPSFTTPLTNNDIAGYVHNIPGNNTGWVNFDINFGIETHALTVVKSGTGSGTVTSNIGGINCGSTCSASYIYGNSVVLSAVSTPGSYFSGWSGAGCSGTGSCTVSMTQARSVTATFELTGTITITTNVQTNWTLNGPQPAPPCNSCPASGSVYTYSNWTPGSGYNLTNVPSLAPYGAPVVSPGLGTNQTLTPGGTINWTITYPISPPTNVSAVANGCLNITVTWTDNSNDENYFQVWRSTTQGGPYAQVSGNLAAMAGTGGTGTYNETPPPNNRYYYVVKSFRTSPASEATSNESNAFLPICIPNLTSSTKAITSHSSSTPIKDGDVVSFEVTITNNGQANATIDYICDTPSSNFINLRNLFVDGGAGSASFSGSDCSSGTEINITGLIIVPGGFRTISFDSDFQSNGSGNLEICSNTAVIHYIDGEGNKTQTVRIPTRLCSKSTSGAPDFDEVAP